MDTIVDLASIALSAFYTAADNVGIEFFDDTPKKGDAITGPEVAKVLLINGLLPSTSVLIP